MDNTALLMYEVSGFEDKSQSMNMRKADPITFVSAYTYHSLFFFTAFTFPFSSIASTSRLL